MPCHDAAVLIGRTDKPTQGREIIGKINNLRREGIFVARRHNSCIQRVSSIIFTPTPMSKNITLTIRNCRDRKRWSQAQTAEQLGVSQSTFNSWESGYKIPTFEQMLRMYRIFGYPEIIDAVVSARAAEMAQEMTARLPKPEAKTVTDRILAQLQEEWAVFS